MIKEHHAEVATILERITDGFYALDRNWNITYWNKEAEVMLGKKKEEVIGKSLWDCFPDATQMNFYSIYHQSLFDQLPAHFEGYYPPKNVWAEMTVYPSQDGLSIFFKNITERKKAEEEKLSYEKTIEKQNQLLTEVLERITEAFFAVDNQWRLTYFNEKAAELAGKKKEDVIGCNLFEQFPKAVGTAIEKNFCLSREKQIPMHFEALSTVRPCLLKFSVYPSANGLTVFYRDITEKKKVREEIKKLSLIAKETVNAVSIVELDGTISWVNNAFTRITGFSEKEALGKRHSVLLNTKESDLTIEGMKANFGKRKSFHDEIIAYTKNKEKRWLSVSAQPMLDDEGRIQHYFFILTDITERKRLEGELITQQKKTTAAVIAAQENERSLVSKELHDNVNQIITTVKLYIELCLSGVEGTDQILKKSSELLQLSIDEIRHLSKKLSAPSLGNIKLNESINELVNSFSTGSRISFKVDTCSIEDHEISQDVHLNIYRIVQEHLTNVLKHAEAKNIQVIITYSDGMINLKISDDGKGFNPKKKSAGIGIANMLSRAESLDGSLQLNSAPGLGCVLIGSFPVSRYNQ
jgi:PAS domain S-box-containing protein